MKFFIFILLFLSIRTVVFAQTIEDNISGLWYSSDSSRIYKVYQTSYGYDANVYSTKRPGDEKGMTVLKEVKFYPGKDDYEGLIYSSDGLQSTGTKIKVEENKKLLLLKLPRLLFFPVYIKWYRVQ
jgi:hypothetical protein